MVDLDRDSVHFGSGIVLYGDREIGIVDEVQFTFQNVGLDEDDGSECYGTASGVLEDKQLIPEFNTREGPSVSLKITVGAGEDRVYVYLKEIEFIDDIAPSGLIKDVEFHGKIEKIV